MFIHSKNKNEKIVLGLLSYTLEEETHQTDLLHAILTSYQQSESKELLLYRETEQDNFIGLIGIDIHKVEDEVTHEQLVESVVIDRVALVPSFRNESMGYQMFVDLKQQYPHSAFIGSRLTSELITKWSQRYVEEHGQ